MNNAEFELHVIPSEFRVAQSESKSYTLRLPMSMLLKQDLNLEQVLMDTGSVAFGHNKPDSRIVVVHCPAGAEQSVEWIREKLRQFEVRVRPQDQKRFISMMSLRKCGLGCVDRRLDDTGVNLMSGEAQITQAGGPLVLHPILTEAMPPAHRANLLRAMELAVKSGAAVGSLNYHFGAEGASGCGMYGALSKANPSIRETLSRPQDVVDMLKMIRDKHARLLQPNTEITGSVLLGGSGDTITYDLDDPDEVKDMLSERNLVL